MNIGIIGLGYWGPNIVRNFYSEPEVKTIIGCDQNVDRLKLIKEKFPQIRLVADSSELFEDNSIDAIVIATPVESHFRLAECALRNGKHVWIEKPLTRKTSEAFQLIDLCEKSKRIAMVDHTFVYTGAVQKMKEIISGGELGDVYYFDSVRANLGLFQHDINVVWDLVPHDLSILQFLIGKKPLAVSAHGLAKFNRVENVAYVFVYLEDGFVAHFTSNWTSPVKIRRIILGGTQKMMLYDDMETDEKIKVYDKGVSVSNSELSVYNPLQIQYRTGDMYSPKVELKEALSVAAKEFIDSICLNRSPLTGLREGADVVRVLEAAEESIKSRGRLVELE
jgi:predicted dehydrogenase